MISPVYRAQLDLLLQAMPHIFREKCFALKGGTAINMFIWDMPRLSVDIDLTYLPFDDRAAAMRNIAEALHHIRMRIEAAIPKCKVTPIEQNDGQESRLICQTAGAQIKIEVNTIMRGAIFEPQEMDISDTVEKEFGRFVTMRVVAPAELFGGKICAALDRQHPRDLFDIDQLFDRGGLTDDIRQGFLICLLSGSRPLHEMLDPHILDQRRAFATQFAGMTQQPFSYQDFEMARERLIRELHAGFSETDRRFLLAFKAGAPDWSLFPHKRLKDLPAVQWKLLNIQTLKSRNPAKHAEQLRALEDHLS